MLRKYLENTPTDPQRLQSNLETILWYSLKCRKKKQQKVKTQKLQRQKKGKKNDFIKMCSDW